MDAATSPKEIERGVGAPLKAFPMAVIDGEKGQLNFSF